jgi:hypothetical protein
MKTPVTTLILGVLIAVPAFAQSAIAQRVDSDREQAIKDCMAMNKQHNTDPYSSTGGVEHMYGACMTNKGRMR